MFVSMNSWPNPMTMITIMTVITAGLFTATVWTEGAIFDNFCIISASSPYESGILETGILGTGILETGTLETGILETGMPETGTLETAFPMTILVNALTLSGEV